MITRAQIRNYKSIGAVTVDLRGFNVFVGRNGTGKSNFLDALSFLADALRTTVEYALKPRGGIKAVRRFSTGHPYNIHIALDIALNENDTAQYAVTISAKGGTVSITEEKCVVNRVFGEKSEFEVRNGRFVIEVPGIKPQLSPDRLALVAVSGTDEFRELFDYLTGMYFYSIIPSKVRELQEPSEGYFLDRDGGNAAAVLKKLRESNDEIDYQLLTEVLNRVVPGLAAVNHKAVGDKETILFYQQVKGASNPWEFGASNMSEGTLRVLGLLLAIYQRNKPKVIGIEEPEATVHPAVIEVLMDVFKTASADSQLLITTHSPDVLDYKGLDEEDIKIVESDKGNTIISGLATKTRELARKKLYSFGDLLRIDELKPSPTPKESLFNGDRYG